MAFWPQLWPAFVYSEPLRFVSYMVVSLFHFMWHCHNTATVKALNEHKGVFKNYYIIFLDELMEDEP